MNKKLINIYNLSEISKLNQSEVFFLVNALRIHPVFSVTKTFIQLIGAFLLFLWIKKLLKISIIITKQ